MASDKNCIDSVSGSKAEIYRPIPDKDTTKTVPWYLDRSWIIESMRKKALDRLVEGKGDEVDLYWADVGSAMRAYSCAPGGRTSSMEKARQERERLAYERLYEVERILKDGARTPHLYVNPAPIYLAGLNEKELEEEALRRVIRHAKERRVVPRKWDRSGYLSDEDWDLSTNTDYYIAKHGLPDVYTPIDPNSLKVGEDDDCDNYDIERENKENRKAWEVGKKRVAKTLEMLKKEIEEQKEERKE